MYLTSAHGVHSEDGGSMFLGYVGIYLQANTVLLPRRPTLTALYPVTDVSTRSASEYGAVFEYYAQARDPAVYTCYSQKSFCGWNR
jgi:hypothetical protein